MRNRVLTSALVCCLLGSAAWSSAALTTASTSFEPGDVRLSTERSYETVSVEGCLHLSEVGRPDLPVKLLRFVIPADSRVEDVVFSCGEVVELPGTHRVAPAQPRVPTGVTPEWVEGEQHLYSSDAPFPSTRVEYLGDGYLGGHRIATVAVHPLVYHPRSGRLLLARDVSVELTLAPAADRSHGRERVTQRSEHTYRKMVAGLVENPQDVLTSRSSATEVTSGTDWFRPRYTPSLEGSAVEYVIVTSDEFEAHFQGFADWKTRLGVPTVVRTISWIETNYPGGVDTPERIRMFLQDAYTSWGTTYVLLGGDTDVVPVRYVPSLYSGGEMIPADIYYSALEGDWNDDGDEFFGEGYGGVSAPGDSIDLYPDIFAGRAPVSSIVELETFISKTQAYVCAPDVMFTDRNLFLAEVLFPYDWESGPFSLDGATNVMEPIIDLFPSDLRLSKLYANHLDFPDSHPVNSAVSIDSLDSGYNIAFHVGHGNKDIIRVSVNNYITMSDVSSLTNSLSRSSFIWLLDCSTAAVDFDCIAERAMNNPDGGGVAAFGASRLEFPATSKDYLWEWVDLLYTHDVYNSGVTCALSKAAFASPDISGSENSHRWTQLTLLLLGDPQLPLWTARAGTLTVSHTSSVEVGETTLSVTVTDGSPVEGALVTVTKEGDVYERAQTGPDGVAVLELRPDTEGTMNVAVTAKDRIPSESTVAVTPAPGPHLYVGSVGLDDDGLGGSSGNGNGQAEAGEAIEIDIEIMNGGVSSSDSLSAALSASDSLVVIDVCSVNIGPVVAGGSAFVGSAFGFTAAEACPSEHDVLFTLELSEGSRLVWADEFAVRVHRPELDLFLLDVDDSAGDGDGVAEAGERVTFVVEVMNEGTGEADSVSGVLSSPSGATEVVQGEETWGSVPGGETRAGTQGFTVILGTDASDTLDLSLVDAYGRTWNHSMDLARPEAPASLWGRVRSTTIELYWESVPDPDLRGYALLRSENPGGPFEQVNAGIIESACYYADSGLAENTLYHYCVTAVDESGNRSAPSSILSISTNPPALAGWPLDAGAGMYASPAVADLDFDGTYEVVVASDHIYAWHSDGYEVLDGDGDPRTGGIFETDGRGGYRGSPAVGEIDGDPGLEIVAAAWADVGDSDDPEGVVYEVFVWNAEDGSVLPGWPVITKRFCWASPALADLDRDGRSEVVLASADGNLYCWRHDGTEYIDGDGTPATVGIFAKLGGSWVYASTAVADLDGDNALELIQPSTNDSVYAFHADGTRVDGWPVCVDARSMCSPAVGDVDGDGKPEVVVGSNASRFWLLEANGTTMPGWPKSVTTTGDFPPSPVLADITGNGELEIVIVGKTGWVVVYDYLGNELPGWPVNLGSDTYSSPAVADLDEDPDMEIVVGSHSGRLFAFDANGEILAGWPIQTDAEVFGSPAVCDLDGDGDSEVIAGGMDTNVYVWDIAGSFAHGDGVEWGAFLHDAWRSQNYGFTIPTGVDDWDEPVGAPLCLLEQNTPNPFNPVTTIGFTIPGEAGTEVSVTLAVYSVDGSLVRTLLNGPATAGRTTVVWDGKDSTGSRVASGVYFYRLAQGSAVETRSMVMMK